MMSRRLLIVAANALAWASAACPAMDDPDIHTAAAAGNAARIEVLLERTPNLIDLGNEAGRTPLHVAVRGLHPSAAETLLDAGADADAKDRDGLTSLHTVMLAEPGPVTPGQDVRGAGEKKEAEHSAQYSEAKKPAIRVRLTKLLLLHGADVNAAEAQGKRPLHLAAMKGRTGVLDLLFEAGADVRATDRFGHTPLHVAALYNQTSVIDWLLSKKANVNAADKQGDTPLHCAVRRFRKEAAERLLKGGAEVNAKNSRGARPLHLAGSEGPEAPEVDRLLAAVAEVLLADGADVNAIDADGLTPLHYALAKKRTALSAVLRRHGGTD